jgi:WD40 repeat protein
VQWKPGGQELATAHYGGVTLWLPESDEARSRLIWQGSSLALAWSPSGRYIATGEQDSTVHFWNVDTGQDLHMYGYETKVRELAWDAGGRWLATGGGSTIPVWDCSGKGPEGRKPVMLKGHDASPSVLQYQRGGPLLLSGGLDGLVAVWHPVKTTKPLAVAQLDRPVAQVAWSPDDQRIAVGDNSGMVTVYSAP